MNIEIKGRYERIIFFIFLAAFFIRIAYIFQILHFPLTEYLVRSNTFDQYGFDSKALSIAHGNWLGEGKVYGKEPLYIYFLAAVYRIFGYSHFAAYLVQSLFSAMGVVLIYRISSLVFNKVTGFIASFIMAFYSMSIFYDAVLLRASLITFLNLLLFYLLIRAGRQARGFPWFAAGAVLGLSMLTRHNILLPFILIFILSKVKPFKGAVKSISLFTVGFFIILLPVVIRNYIVSDYNKICISSEVNAFWVGNTYNSSGVDVVWSPEYHRLERASEGKIGRTAGLFLDEARKRPRQYLNLYIRKVWMFFNAYEAPSNTNYYLYREEFPTVLKWPLFDFRFICPLGIIGMLLALRRRDKSYMLACIFLAALSCSVILFHIQSRFRLPVAPFFIIFASYSIYNVFEDARNRRFMKPITLLSLAVFLYIILRPDITYAGFRKEGHYVRPNDRTNLALAYIDAYGRNEKTHLLDLAMTQAVLAIHDDRKFSSAYRIKGYLYFLQKDYAGAISEYKKSIIYNNRDPFLYNELAGVYYRQESYLEASLYIRRALRLFPGNKILKRNLDMIPVK